MDLNVLMIAGRLAVAPDVCEHGSGMLTARLLVATRQEAPVRRVDVLPVRVPDPGPDLLGGRSGQPVCISGSLQRHFSPSDTGRRSRLEVVADHVSLGSSDVCPGSLPRP